MYKEIWIFVLALCAGMAVLIYEVLSLLYVMFGI